MNKIIKTAFTLILFIAMFGAIEIEVKALDSAHLNLISGCSPSTTSKNYYSNNFNAEIEKRGIPKSIKVNGKTLSINKDLALSNCLVVYGDHSSLPSSGKYVQKYHNGEYRFLGYGVDGKPVQNLVFMDLTASIDFVKITKFLKHPWNNTALNDAITPQTSKPPTRNITSVSITDGMVEEGLTKQSQLSKAIDGFYLRYEPNPFGSGKLGVRGYFPYQNTALGITLNGTNLMNYASVDFFPDKYTFGIFNMYHNCTAAWDGFCYSNYAMPPLSLLFDPNSEKPDLAVTNFNVSKASPWEREYVTFSFTVKNQGKVNIKDPKVKLTFAGSTSYTTFPGILKPGESATSSTKIRVPEITADKTYTATVKANPDEDNPKFDNMSNNQKTVNVNAKNITRDLYVHSINIDGNVYFNGNTEKLDKLFEGEEIVFSYKLGFDSNKTDEKIVNPVVKFGKEGGKQKEERLTRTINAGEVTPWIKASFDYSK